MAVAALQFEKCYLALHVSDRNRSEFHSAKLPSRAVRDGIDFPSLIDKGAPNERLF
jgi:hypothetical protein